MKNIISAILAFSFLVPVAQAAESADQAALKKIVDKLDVTSFSNSFGPRRVDGKVTFNDYGVSKVTFNNKKAVVSEPDNSWQFTITLLDSKSSQAKICFEDEAQNGGSYHSQDAYLLMPDKRGFLKASTIKDVSCPEFAK